MSAAATAPVHCDESLAWGEQRTRLGARKWWMAAMAVLACFSAELSFTGCLFAAPVIVQETHTDRYQMNWALGPYLVLLVVAVLIAPRVQASFGSRLPFILGCLSLAVGCVIAATATDLTGMIVARVFMAGKGVMMAVALSQLWIVFPRERGLTMAMFAASTTGALPITMALGAILTFNPTWRAVYGLAATGALIGAVGGFVHLRPDRPDHPQRGGWDLPGTLLLCAWLAGLTFALLMGQYFGWWADPLVSAVLGLTLIAFLLFVWRELTTPRPLVTLAIKPARTLGLVLVVLGIYSVVVVGGLELLAAYFTLRGYQGPQSGGVLLPCGLAFGVTMLLAGQIRGRDRNLWSLRAGMALLTVGTVLLTRLDLYTPRWWTLAVLCGWGVGGGLVLPTGLWLTFEGQSAVAVQRLATVKMALRFLGLVVGALGATVVANRAADWSFDELRQDITWTRSAPFQVQAALERHATSLGSHESIARDQASGMLGHWLQERSQAAGIQTAMQYLAATSAVGLVVSLGVRSRRRMTEPADLNVLACAV